MKRGREPYDVEGLLDGDWLYALGAAVSGVSAALMGYAAVVSARRKGDKECEERLAALRSESETVADELHDLRMKLRREA